MAFCPRPVPHLALGVLWYIHDPSNSKGTVRRRLTVIGPTGGGLVPENYESIFLHGTRFLPTNLSHQMTHP
jgi:hypothetical protein